MQTINFYLSVDLVFVTYCGTKKSKLHGNNDMDIIKFEK